MQEAVAGRAGARASEDSERIGFWITKGFTALIGISATLLVSFGGWLSVNVNQIHHSTSILQTEFTSYKSDMGELKTAVDDLRIRGEGWATKDSLLTTKDALREDLAKLRDQVNTLEVRMARVEAASRISYPK